MSKNDVPKAQEPADPTQAEADNGACEEESSEALSALLRSALPDADPRADVLQGVQQRLRRESGGRFYSDGWSTGRSPPIRTYLVTSLVMLCAAIILYLLVAWPLGGVTRVEPVDGAAAPGASNAPS